MNPKRRLFRGCNATAINPQLYESFKEALAVDNVDSLIHKKDIEFMKSACDLYDSKKARSILGELVARVSGHVNIAD
jgi:hypothetical protein